LVLENPTDDTWIPAHIDVPRKARFSVWPGHSVLDAGRSLYNAYGLEVDGREWRRILDDVTEHSRYVRFAPIKECERQRHSHLSGAPHTIGLRAHDEDGCIGVICFPAELY
jgi:hypothetical protein